MVPVISACIHAGASASNPKDEGNALHTQGRYAKAADKYRAAMNMLAGQDSPAHGSSPFLLARFLNFVACLVPLQLTRRGLTTRGFSPDFHTNLAKEARYSQYR